MRNAIGIVLAAGSLACAGSAPAAVTPTPGAAPLDLATLDAKPPAGMRYYYLAFLRRGPNWTAESTPESERLGEGHMANIGQLARDGTLVLAGPFLDSDGPGDLAGVFVLAVDSIAAARAAIEKDPAVKAGRFSVELRAWLAGDGIQTSQDLPPLPQTEAQLRCRDSEQYRQFDFWLGDWDVQTPGGDRAGRNRIEKGQYGCVVRESWTGARGGTGESVNYVDPATQEWIQVWTDSGGGVINLRGKLDGKSMVLTGDYLEPGKPATRIRGTWTPMDGGRVRQLFEQSTDGGATFVTSFEGIYVRR